MKSNRIYLLLVILSVLVISSLSNEETSHTDDPSFESKRRSNAAEKNEQRQRQKNRKNEQEVVEPENTDELNGFLPSYADNRYTASNGLEGNYRTRQRWQQQQFPSKFPIFTSDDSTETEDWSGIGIPNPIQINLPSMPFGNPQTIDNSPTCYSLVDSQYPIFADVCGAVPQARYSLPNALGLHERWQLAQFLTNIVGSSTEPGCTRSLRLLVCPILFPPCQSRQDTPPVLPCQSYCRAVKSRCSIPTLDALACETLPFVSDICPTNQAYGSFIPPVVQTPFIQQSPLNSGVSPSNYQTSRTLASLQSLLAAQGGQSQYNQASFPTQDVQAQYNPAFLTSQDVQSQYNPTFLASQNRQSLSPQQYQQQQQQQGNPSFLSTKKAQSQGSPLQVNARNPYSADSLSSMLAELTAQSNGYPQAQNQRYATQLARASPAEVRYANLAYPRVAASQVASVPTAVPSGVSSLVKA